jgi:hypothetical protein
VRENCAEIAQRSETIFCFARGPWIVLVALLEGQGSLLGVARIFRTVIFIKLDSIFINNFHFFLKNIRTLKKSEHCCANDTVRVEGLHICVNYLEQPAHF